MVVKTDKTFVKITNKDIFTYLEQKHEKDTKNFMEIKSRLDVTNGKVKKAMWIATTALTIALMAIGFCFQS